MHRIGRIVLGAGILFLAAKAGSLPVRPDTDVCKVPAIGTGGYFGIGYGWMQMTDRYTDEFFRTFPPMVVLGYQLNDTFALEGRYTRSTKVQYEGGKTFNPDRDDFPTVFSNVGLYLKGSYPIQNVSLYALLGYGQIRLTDIKGSDRTQRSVQWGGGIEYRINSRLGVFADAIRLYSDKGFGGRAQERTVNVTTIMTGVTYAF